MQSSFEAVTTTLDHFCPVSAQAITETYWFIITDIH